MNGLEFVAFCCSGFGIRIFCSKLIGSYSFSFFPCIKQIFRPTFGYPLLWCCWCWCCVLLVLRAAGAGAAGAAGAAAAGAAAAAAAAGRDLINR